MVSAPSRRPPRLPARVYWVRRLLLLGVVVALGWGVVAVLGGEDTDTRQAASRGDIAGDPPAATPTTPTASPTEPAPADGEQSQQGGQQGQQDDSGTRPRVVTATLPTAQGDCLAADVTVVPAVAPRPPSGSEVAIALAVATGGDTACRLELSPEILVVKVSTGGRPVWDTEQCPGAVPERTVVLRPDWTAAVTVTWPGIYGDKGCTGTTRDGPPGAYAVEAAVYEGEPGRTDIDLQPPQAEPPDEGDGQWLGDSDDQADCQADCQTDDQTDDQTDGGDGQT